MASAAAKKAQQGNEFLLKNLRMFIVFSLIWYSVPSILIPLLLKIGGRAGGVSGWFTFPTIKSFITSATTTAFTLFLYFQLFKMSKGPTAYNLEGKGLHQFMMDFIYINSIVHIFLPLSTRSFYIFSLIPLIGAWKVWEFIKLFKGGPPRA